MYIVATEFRSENLKVIFPQCSIVLLSYLVGHPLRIASPVIIFRGLLIMYFRAKPWDKTYKSAAKGSPYIFGPFVLL